MEEMKMNRLFFTTLLVASVITANAQVNAEADSLTMETMMHNIPEVMVKGSRPIVKAERGMLSYNMPLLLKQLPADNAYEALTRIPGISLCMERYILPKPLAYLFCSMPPIICPDS